jgi:hypothetical protein
LPTAGGFLLDPRVDRLPGDLPPTIPGKLAPCAARDLIGRPELLQVLADVLPDFGAIHFPHPRAVVPPLSGLLLGLAGIVAIAAAIAPQLSRNRPRIATELLGNGSHRQTGHMPLGYLLTLLQGK